MKWKTFDTMVDRLALHIDDSNYVHNSTELVLLRIACNKGISIRPPFHIR